MINIFTLKCLEFQELAIFSPLKSKNKHFSHLKTYLYEKLF
jgi:hypothetical protein